MASTMLCVPLAWRTAICSSTRRPARWSAGRSSTHDSGHLRTGDVLVVTKLDRMARSVKHLCQIMEALRTIGADLRVLDQGIDTTTRWAG